MKIGLFADPHYSTRETSCLSRRPSLSYAKTIEAVNAFRNAGVRFIVCLGDLIDSDVSKEQEQLNLAEIGGILANSGIPCYFCMGNHDAFIFRKEEFERFSGLRTSPCSFSIENKLFILLDACFHSDGSAYNHENTDWTDSYIPNEQIEWLKAVLKNSPAAEVIVFVHQNLDPAVEKHHLIKNAPQIREILENDGRVKTIYQGHYHPGKVSIHSKISYITLKAMCEGNNNSYHIIDI